MRFKHLNLLLQRQWFENRKAWLIGTMAIAAILSFLLLLSWRWQTSFNGDTTRGIFLIVLFVSGSLFVSTLLKDLSNKQKGIWFLILPASALAKLTVALFYGILVYIIVYMGLFYGVRAFMLWILNEDGNYWGQFDLMKNGFYHMIFIFINFQSAILLGSVYFNKSQFLKTVLLLLILLFIVFNGNGFFLQLITRESNINSNIPLDSFQFTFNHENIHVNASPAFARMGSIFLYYVLSPVLWLITWFRIKEKEL